MGRIRLQAIGPGRFLMLSAAVGLVVAGLLLPGASLARHGLTFRDIAYPTGPGKFKSKLKGTTAKTEHGKLNGTWIINLPSYTSGHVGLTWNGKRVSGGTYRIVGEDITITPGKTGACSTKGKYKLVYLSETKIKFSKLSDTCTPRKDVLTYGPWTKVT